jgi:diguanylate cyclase (GGDEF)-like protein/PAS domain S-box-containing protein
VIPFLTVSELGILANTDLRASDSRRVLAQLEASERNKALILDTMTEGMVLQETDGRIIEWNPAAERLLGLTADELSGRSSTDPRWMATRADGTPWPGETHPAMEVLRTGTAISDVVMGVHRPRDSRVWLRVNASPIIDAAGTTTGVLCTFADITAERLAAQESEGLAEQLRRGEEMARVSLDALEQGVVLANRGGEILRINPAAKRLLGYDVTELSSMWISDRWITCDAAGTPLAIEQRPSARAARSGQPVIGEVVHLARPDGTRLILRVSCIPDVDESGAMVIAFADITEETNLVQTLSRYQYMFENSNDLILIIDADNRSIFASPSVHRLFGTDPADTEVVAALRQRIHPDDQQVLNDHVDGLREETVDTAPVTVRVLDRHGEWRHIEILAVSLMDEPTVAGVVLTARDVTDREHAAEHLTYRATHDALTDLPNRALFDSELAAAVEKAEGDHHLLAVCYLDLDNFKDINDTYGHDVGDELLRGVAGTLLGNVRAWDTPARIGGDEFVVLLDPVRGPADALATAHRIRQRLVELGAKFNVAFGASVGISFNRTGDTPATLLRRADRALYLAKSSSTMPVRVDFDL